MSYRYEDHLEFVTSVKGTNKRVEILNKLMRNEQLSTMDLLGSGDSFESLACIDWLVRKGFLEEIRYSDIRNEWMYRLTQKGLLS